MNEVIKQSIEVSPNLTVTVIYTHTGPRPAPAFGATWDAQVDYPTVTAELRLPAVVDGALVYYLRQDRRCFGDTLDSYWGGVVHDSHERQRTQRYDAPTVRAAYNMAVADVAAAVQVLAEVVDARNARLRERNATIRASRINSPFAHVD